MLLNKKHNFSELKTMTILKCILCSVGLILSTLSGRVFILKENEHNVER